MAVDYALTTSNPSFNLTLSGTIKVVSFTGLARFDLTAATQDIRWQYGDKSAGMDATKYQKVLAGVTATIPRDPSKRPDEVWYVSIVRDSVDTFTCGNGYNQSL